ncbi:hypothetical protein E2C01_038432 [Portunus trituberculatus]|uniref:Uncharacterized protein n=1 Tax=Portunus trituberculatus TaxID=210409 RepID=A0A5B7FHZ3_PORTR|nr:hypothetical protein [Portunus trituberculatus]
MVISGMIAVISDLIAKLDGNPAASVSVGSGADFSGFTAISSGDKESKIPEGAADPLEGLDLCDSPQPDQTKAGGDNAKFLHALEELSGYFHSKEENDEPLSVHLATILYSSLRSKPSSDGVKSACGKINSPPTYQT